MLYVIGYGFVLCGLADLVMLHRWGVEATISHQVLTLSRQYPVLPFVAGLLAGHLWWGQP